MAQAFGTGGAGIKRRTVYIREGDAYTRPSTLGAVDTLRNSGTKFGKFDDKSIKWNFDDGNKRPLNDGTDLVQDWVGKFEAALANFTPENVENFETEFDNEECDIILDDPVAKDMVVIKATVIHGRDEETSGDKGVYHIYGEKRVNAKSSFRDRFSYASFPDS